MCPSVTSAVMLISDLFLFQWGHLIKPEPLVSSLSPVTILWFSAVLFAALQFYHNHSMRFN